MLDRCPHLNPVTTILDFEAAKHKAILSVYPHTTLRGCLDIPPALCVWKRHVFSTSVSVNSDSSVSYQDSRMILRSQLYSVFGIPFLLLQKVLLGWMELKAKLSSYPIPQLSKYIAFFQNTWIFSTRYPPTLWNINSAVEYNEPQTNNVSEGGNNSLSL